MEKNIAVIRGDGIGPEIVAQAVAVLERVAERFGHRFTFTEAEMGRLCHRPLWREPAGGEPADERRTAPEWLRHSRHSGAVAYL